MLYNDLGSTALVRVAFDGPDTTGTPLDDAAVRDLELLRARRSLAYLKSRIGNEAMRDLLRSDLDETARRAERWARDSAGRWRSGTTTLTAPGPRAAYFRDWFLGNLAQRNEAVFLAAHPDHYVDHPLPGGPAEVVENFGEDDLPWQIFLEFTGSDVAFPTPWDPAYPAEFAFGGLVRTAGGVLVGSVIHEFRDAVDGDHRAALEVKLTVHVPEAAPARLVQGHLRHFAIEFRNWTEMARAGVAGVVASRT